MRRICSSVSSRRIVVLSGVEAEDIDDAAVEVEIPLPDAALGPTRPQRRRPSLAA
jgi:hypothetical protein